MVVASTRLFPTMQLECSFKNENEIMSHPCLKSFQGSTTATRISFRLSWHVMPSATGPFNIPAPSLIASSITSFAPVTWNNLFPKEAILPPAVFYLLLPWPIWKMSYVPNSFAKLQATWESFLIHCGIPRTKQALVHINTEKGIYWMNLTPVLYFEESKSIHQMSSE